MNNHHMAMMRMANPMMPPMGAPNMRTQPGRSDDKGMREPPDERRPRSFGVRRTSRSRSARGYDGTNSSRHNDRRDEHDPVHGDDGSQYGDRRIPTRTRSYSGERRPARRRGRSPSPRYHGGNNHSRKTLANE